MSCLKLLLRFRPVSVKIPPPVNESRSGKNMAALRYYEIMNKTIACVCIFSMAARCMTVCTYINHAQLQVL